VSRFRRPPDLEAATWCGFGINGDTRIYPASAIQIEISSILRGEHWRDSRSH
jgi:hypothetical protein